MSATPNNSLQPTGAGERGFQMLGWFKKKSPPPNGPDFSGIDSQAKAEELFRRGDLEKMFLMPLAFGGEDIPDNILYVPVGQNTGRDRVSRLLPRIWPRFRRDVPRMGSNLSALGAERVGDGFLQEGAPTGPVEP